MSAPQGVVTYPGMTTFTKAEYVLSQGISPGKCTIELPQELVSELEPTGDLVITYADQTITIPNCLLDDGHLDQVGNGYVARVTILDRRWQWKFGYISGHYNLRMPSGSNANEGFSSQATAAQGDSTKIMPGTEMAPQDIATLCLQAMGEQNYDVSALPNQARPEIGWSWTNPAQALESLCEGLGCRVTYVIDSDSVTIVTIGQGQPLPDNGLQTFVSAGVNPPNTPSSLQLVGGPTIYQGYLLLEAVGLDIDGSIQLINNLSYAPQAPDGQPPWSQEPPDSMPHITDPTTKSIALASVYKMWRLALPITVPGSNPPNVTDIRQIRMYDRLLDTNFDPNDSSKIIPKKPELWGTFDDKFKQTVQTQTKTPGTYLNSLTIDEARWLIITEDALYVHQNQQYAPAGLLLKIAYSVRDPTTWEPVRYTRTMQLDSSLNTQPRILHREEIFVKVVGSYQSFSNNNGFVGVQLEPPGPLGTTDNIESDQLDQEADYYLQAAAQEYIEQDSFHIPYAGIVDIQVDGLIQQVTWTITSGPGGSTMTNASLAMEHNPYVLPWEARRQKIQLGGDAARLLAKFAARPQPGRKNAGPFIT